MLPLAALLAAPPAAGNERRLTPGEAKEYLGEVATVCGKVASSYYDAQVSTSPTFLNVGRPYPNHELTIVILQVDRGKFGAPEYDLMAASICVTGRIGLYRGVPYLLLRNQSDLKVESGSGKRLRLKAIEAVDHIGERATVCGKVVSAYAPPRTLFPPLFLMLDHTYPKLVFSFMINNEDRPNFGEQPEIDLIGKRVCVTGAIGAYYDYVYMRILDPSQLVRDARPPPVIRARRR